MMDRKHLEMLRQVFAKLGMLSQEQVFFLLKPWLKQRGIYYCIEELIRHDCILPAIRLRARERLYVARKEVLRELPGNLLAPKYSQNPIQFNHRLACHQVAFALARRSGVLGVALEHELRNLGTSSPVTGRWPDLIVLADRPGQQPMTLAVEVESSYRNHRRVKQVIQAYLAEFESRPGRLTGVIVVATHPTIAGTYQAELEKITHTSPRRFLISRTADLSDVRESVLGRTLTHPSENPRKPLQRRCVDCNDGAPIFELADFASNQGTQRESQTTHHHANRR